MENFYRYMRKKYDVLMDGNKPVGGQWNFDMENRNKLPEHFPIPQPKVFNRNVENLKNEIDTAKINYFGRIDTEHYEWPVSHAELIELFNHFLEKNLSFFGSYQDAFTEKSWSIFHSRISFGLNIKLLHPLDIIRKSEAYWKKHRDDITIAQAEGFIRQIMGWREYTRGIYWTHMPDYKQKNYFNHEKKLPQWFWTGQTKMKCLSHAINQSLDHAYAHHIQRLMVTGNFGLLAGIHPDEMDAWYLGDYIDALEWVEITNTRGMSQYADGGIVGTKSYVSSANYIHKMGHYCGGCLYKNTVKTGKKACPFNSLYWHFYVRNRKKLQDNPRVNMMYRTWDKMDHGKQSELLDLAENYLEHLNEL